jgi:predicted RNase H-like HicB family nuclease
MVGKCIRFVPGYNPRTAGAGHPSTVRQPRGKLGNRRPPTMNRTAPPPIAVDVVVTLTAVVRPEEGGGYSASIPALPGCHTQGETIDEVRDNLREAAEGWLAVAHDDGSAADGAAP